MILLNIINVYLFIFVIYIIKDDVVMNFLYKFNGVCKVYF